MEYSLLATLLLITLTSAAIQQYFESIIVGAGIAGIGASMMLSNNSVPHLLLQARSRIGGRITSFIFANTTQQLGAAFIQIPSKQNLVNPYVSAFELTKIPANFQVQTAWYTNKSICAAKDLSTAQPVFNSLLNYIYRQAYILQNDRPVQTVVQQYWVKHPEYHGFVKDRVKFQMQIVAIDNGAELSNMSTYQFYGSDGSEYKNDYAPQNGYTSLVHDMFRRYCKPDLHLSERVLTVDYSGQYIRVTTNKDTYTTNKLFLAVPLGVLKAQQIEFIPSLPNDKQEAIDSMGNGYYQKLFVIFSKPFWPRGSSTLHFINKNSKSRYAQAWVVSPCMARNKNLLIFWISGDLAKQLTTWQFDQIKQDLKDNLQRYIPQQVQITDLYLTDWLHDPLTLGGYSYAKVGMTEKHFRDIKTAMRSRNNWIWFIGQYVDSQLYSFSHGAFKTGVQAAQQSLKL